MYKIYINETPLFLMTKDAALEAALGRSDVLIGQYTGKTKFLLNYIDMLEKTQRFEGVYLYAKDVKAMFKDFKSLFKKISAAGGVVHNAKAETLFIYRRGFWDLPKGKIDRGEGKKEAAVREVMEETGLQVVELQERLLKTYHTYKLSNDRRVLKKTFWYRMKTQEETLIPQAEEDIEEAVWLKTADFLKSGKKVYGSILDVLKASL